MLQINYSKQRERNEERLRDDLGINVFYDLLSANAPHAVGHRDSETWCTYIFLVAYSRHQAFLAVYQRRQHRAWRFRGHATRQRAVAMLINRMAGRCVDEEWKKIQTRLEPGDKQGRRFDRRVWGVAAYPTTPRIFAWGDGSWNHTRPWAPVPRQVKLFFDPGVIRCIT
jgi:hypothetical protein